VTVTVQPIEDDALLRVGEFLHRELNQRVSAAAWASAAVPPWPVDAPNRGYMLEADGRVVGAHLAFYSERLVDGHPVRFCNLGAWCVEESYRAHAVKLLRALLKQDGYAFTDLSPSGSVVPLNERLRFTHLDTTTDLVPCLPYPSRPRRITVTTGANVAARLPDGQRRLHADHVGAAAAHHLVLSLDDRACYVVWRRDRRKGLPVFASLLHVSDPEVLGQGLRVLARHLLLRHGVLVLLVERRLVGARPWPSILQRRPRRKMVRSDRVDPERLDYLYSELACVAW
jgi:hypothetical protein